MKKRLFLFSTLLFLINLSAQEPSVFISSGLALPLGPTLSDNDSVAYSTGFKIDGRGNIPLTGPLALHTQLGYNLAPLSGAQASGKSFNLLSLQAGPALNVPLGDKLELGTVLQGGGYLGFVEGSMGGSGVISARADVNFSFNDSLLLGLGADYSYYLMSGSSVMDHAWSGLGASLNLSYRLGRAERKSRLEIKNIIIFPIYPVLYGFYSDNKLGEVTIVNKESGPIENLAVSLYIPKYMAGPQTFQTGESLARGEEKTLDIFGLLDSSILDQTEGELVQAQVGVSYDLRKDILSRNGDSQAEILYRNALAWTDDRRAASFVTAKEPGIMEFAKNTKNALRDRINSELDESLINAMIIFEALRLYGLNYQIDPSSSYQDLAGQQEVLDYLQFPIETLNYRAGDCDDLSVLYTALLESLAVETAFITIPGHIYTAVALNMEPEEAQRTFASAEDLILLEGKAWIPVEATMVDGGSFMDAWRTGSRQWNEAALNDQARLYPVQDAWQLYPPVALNAYRDKELALPDSESLRSSYSGQVLSLIDRETSAQVAYLEKAIRESRGERRNRMVNSLAVLKARYGLFDEAVSLLKGISGDDGGYAPGAVNLGNIYYRQDKLDLAWDYYNRALNIDPDQAKAVLGIMMVESDRGNNLAVQNAYGELAKLSPSLAEKYSYLATGSDDVKRASRAGQKEKVLWEDD